ncbi:MAG: hypothetical protein EBY76_00995 [Betaproteobacteria bacterium]|nr:hypothetical protein [Betaproteobacteria bacterium]
MRPANSNDQALPDLLDSRPEKAPRQSQPAAQRVLQNPFRGRLTRQLYRLQPTPACFASPVLKIPPAPDARQGQFARPRLQARHAKKQGLNQADLQLAWPAQPVQAPRCPAPLRHANGSVDAQARLG